MLELAIKELQRIDAYKAPRDKLVCVLNTCRVINNALLHALKFEGRPTSADDFLPLLIYTVLKANPPQLHSSVEFIATFRHPSRLVSEDAYFLTAMQSAVAFVQEVGPDQLVVAEDEYWRNYREAERQYDREVAAEQLREAATAAAAAAAAARSDPQPDGPTPMANGAGAPGASPPKAGAAPAGKARAVARDGAGRMDDSVRKWLARRQ